MPEDVRKRAMLAACEAWGEMYHGDDHIFSELVRCIATRDVAGAISKVEWLPCAEKWVSLLALLETCK